MILLVLEKTYGPFGQIVASIWRLSNALARLRDRVDWGMSFKNSREQHRSRPHPSLPRPSKKLRSHIEKINCRTTKKDPSNKGGNQSLKDLRFCDCRGTDLTIRRMGTQIKFYPLTLKITHAKNVTAKRECGQLAKNENSASTLEQAHRMAGVRR